MTEEVWSARNTNPDEIEAALREMLRELHKANQSLAPARVLNLVVVVDREWKGEIANRLERVGRYHASRTVLCVVQPSRATLDARVVMHFDETNGGRPGVIREEVEVDVGAGQLHRLDTVVDPVLVSELPTVLWCPHGHEEAVRALGGIFDVMLIDSDDLLEPGASLARAQALLEDAYVVDLAWLRTTPWRERLAASFDPPHRRAALGDIHRFEVRHQASSCTSALLLAGWMASRLGWNTDNGVDVRIQGVDQAVPGLSGVTVQCDSGFSLSLDRARGGLCARVTAAAGDERVWRVLGASRGEGGILGEGVRQALLRDPTYGPALERARGMAA